MGKKYEEIDRENLHIAQMLKRDSEKIKEKEIDENVIEKIRNYKEAKRNVYKIVSAMAACILVCVTVFAWKNLGIRLEDISINKLEKEVKRELNSDENVRVAKSYSEITQKIEDMSDSKYKIAKSDGDIINEVEENFIGKKSATVTNKDEYSQTNRQTENVDEADIVRTDGKYIYTLSSRQNDTEKEKNGDYDVCWVGWKYRLTITEVEGKKMKIVSSINIEDKEIKVFDTMEMYISGDTLVIVGGFVKDEKQSQMATCIYTYDITNKKDIKLTNKNVQDGSYFNSRMVDGYLYTISEYSFETYKAEECVPEINGRKMDYRCVYIPQRIENKWPEYTVITSLNINKSDGFTSNISILGGVNDIYVSQNNIYIINLYCDIKDITKTRKGRQIIEKQKIKKEYRIEKNTDCTKIMKYSYKNGMINYVATTNVLGGVDDQFSLDEKDGYLRMVTSVNNVITTNLYLNRYHAETKKKEKELVETLDNEEIENYNNVYVLENNLKTVASIKGLAKDEEIYAARFLGDYGYFVSFENTDPLFTIDFSDMKNPKVVGELKMPGFSDYLQFYKEDLLFGIGENGDEKGNLLGLKMDMYDVKNGEARLKTKQVLKDYDYSDALYDYKAILVDSTKGLIGFYADKNSKPYETYYLLYTYKNNRFKRVLEIPLGKYVENIRGLYIGDYYYIVNPKKKIIAVNLKNYKKEAVVKIK